MDSSADDPRLLLSRHIRLQIVARPKRSDEVYAKRRQEVDDVWDEARGACPSLFNGTAVSLLYVSQRPRHLLLEGHGVDYKYVYASRCRPDLELGIRPIGVSGLLVLQERAVRYIVVARRRGSVAMYPDHLELPPSGSIDGTHVSPKGRVDHRAQLLSELADETGLSAGLVAGIDDLALVHDIRHRVYDIGCRIALRGSRRTVARAFAGSRDYRDVVFVPTDGIESFLATTAHAVVPTSVALLRAHATI